MLHDTGKGGQRVFGYIAVIWRPLRVSRRSRAEAAMGFPAGVASPAAVAPSP